VLIVKIKNTEKISLNQGEFYYLLRNFIYYLDNRTNTMTKTIKLRKVNRPFELKPFIFTTKNLIKNLKKLGPWSSYGLATTALAHYFPDLYDEEIGKCPEVHEEVELLLRLGCISWQNLIKKYHLEVGYNPKDGIFNPDAVNRY
jgi:hypothetical protein